MFTNLATVSVSAFPTTLDSEAKLMRSETMAAVPWVLKWWGHDNPISQSCRCRSHRRSHGTISGWNKRHRPKLWSLTLTTRIIIFDQLEAAVAFSILVQLRRCRRLCAALAWSGRSLRFFWKSLKKQRVARPTCCFPRFGPVVSHFMVSCNISHKPIHWQMVSWLVLT